MQKSKLRIFFLFLSLSSLNFLTAKEIIIKSQNTSRQNVEKNTPIYLYQNRKSGYFFYEDEKSIRFEIKETKLYINGKRRGVIISKCDDLKSISSTVDNLLFSTNESLKCIYKLSLPSDNPIYLHIFPEDQDEHEVSAYLNKDQINKIASLPLKGLSLVRVKTEDLSALGNLKNLIYLSINIYEKDLKFIKKLTSLKSLKLQFISNKDLKYISGLTNLQHLDLRSIMTADFYTNKITDEGLYYLRNLKNLEILHLTYTNIDGSGIKHLSKMKNLRFLNLLQCPIKNENDVKKKLKHIKLLKINFDDMGQL